MLSASGSVKDNSLCILPECINRKYFDSTSGVTHDYCGKTHAEEGKRRGISEFYFFYFLFYNLPINHKTLQLMFVIKMEVLVLWLPQAPKSSLLLVPPSVPSLSVPVHAMWMRVVLYTNAVESLMPWSIKEDKLYGNVCCSL